MAAQLVPIRLSVTDGDFYALWAPRWRDEGDEWEGFLGEEDDLFVFDSVADLTAFVRTDTTNDLVEHPAWPTFVRANAHTLVPAADRHADLVGLEALLAAKPSEESVAAIAHTLAVVSSIGTVCELPAVSRFFNGNPNLGWVTGGVEQFAGRAGRKRWDTLGEIVSRNWDGVLSAVDEVLTTPGVDSQASAQAAAELDEPYEEVEEEPVAAEEAVVAENADEATDSDDSEETEVHTASAAALLGGDAKFWEHVGIDPICVMGIGGMFYTLRCYFDDKPLFLGRNGRISAFSSERLLARFLADDHDHDLSDLSTYDDIRTAATDGSLRVDVTEDNVYVLSDLVEDLVRGPSTVDPHQLELAVEFVRDVGTYSEDDLVDRLLKPDTAIGHLVEFVLNPHSSTRPTGPFAAAVAEWEEIERFIESRIRRE